MTLNHTRTFANSHLLMCVYLIIGYHSRDCPSNLITIRMQVALLAHLSTLSSISNKIQCCSWKYNLHKVDMVLVDTLSLCLQHQVIGTQGDSAVHYWCMNVGLNTNHMHLTSLQKILSQQQGHSGFGETHFLQGLALCLQLYQVSAEARRGPSLVMAVALTKLLYQLRLVQCWYPHQAGLDQELVVSVSKVYDYCKRWYVSTGWVERQGQVLVRSVPIGFRGGFRACCFMLDMCSCTTAHACVLPYSQQ